MKKLLVSIIAALVAVTSFGAPLSPKQKQQVIKQVNQAVSGLQSMTCTFEQTKHMSMLNDKMVSHGKMSYKRPDKLRWEYTSPYKYLFIFNGSKVYVGNNSKKNVIDANSNKVFREVARIIMNTVTGKALSNLADFSADVTDNGKFWTVTLIPKKKVMSKMFKKIELVFNKSNSMIAEVNIYEKNGDRTNIKMKNISKNTSINEAVFSIPAK